MLSGLFIDWLFHHVHDFHAFGDTRVLEVLSVVMRVTGTHPEASGGLCERRIQAVQVEHKRTEITEYKKTLLDCSKYRMRLFG